MHVYAEDFSKAEALASAGVAAGAPMPAMPQGGAWRSATALLKFELKVRGLSAAIDGRNVGPLIREAEALGSYWGQFGLILLLHAAVTRQKPGPVGTVLERIDPLYRRFLGQAALLAARKWWVVPALVQARVASVPNLRVSVTDEHEPAHPPPRRTAGPIEVRVRHAGLSGRKAAAKMDLLLAAR